MSTSLTLSQAQASFAAVVRNSSVVGSTVCIPRLMSGKQAAAYLGFKSVEVLKTLAIIPIKLAKSGPGSAPRYDRVALDAYLDSLSNIARYKEPQYAEDEAQFGFEEWERSRAVRH